MKNLPIVLLATLLPACISELATPGDTAQPVPGLRFDGMITADGALRFNFRSWGREVDLFAIQPVSPVQSGGMAVRTWSDIEEWWLVLPFGLEQGWTVHTPPPGDGPLVLEVEVNGGELAVQADSIEIRSGSRTWRYGDARAEDATGRALPISLSVVDDTIRVRVDDAGAEYPIEIDPTLTESTWFVQSNVANQNLGWVMSTAGDVNGDAYNDLLITAPRYGNGELQEGRGLLYLSGASGPDFTRDWAVESGSSGAQLGAGGDFAGDVNGDGYDDVILGCPECSWQRYWEGSAFLYQGSATGLSTSETWRFNSGTQYAELGTCVGGGGDFNHDGYGDILLGAPYFANGQTQEGAAFMFLGSVSGLGTTPSWTVESDIADAMFGWGVANVGDVNGDAFDDAIIGALNYTGAYSRQGRVYLYLGLSTGLGPVAVWTWDGAQANEGLGGRGIVANADFNGDGYSDIAIGSPNYDASSDGVGRAMAFMGSASGLGGSPSWQVVGTTLYESVGSSLSAADFDGDGYGDLAVGVPSIDNPEIREGEIWVYLGSASGLSTSVSQVLTENHAYGQVGLKMGRAGDVNGDGSDDLLIGGPYYTDGESMEGAAYLWVGPSVAADNDGDGYFTGSGNLSDCDDSNPAIHPGVVEVCDGVDNDCDGSTDEGVSTIYYRDADGDGYGSASTILSACSLPAGYVLTGTDCDDAHATAHPGGTETVADGIDGNCDGQETCQADADHDGWGSTSIISSSDLDCTDYGESSGTTDCNDLASSVHPGATELVADGVDQDCDGGDTCYKDADGDTWGTSTRIASPNLGCTDPGEAVVATDCNDGDFDTHPGAVEVVADQIDQNCDGMDACYADGDHDGYGGSSTLNTSDLDCTDLGEAATSTDCNDSASSIHPGATETVADNIDQDCDGGDTCYLDADGDSYGSTTSIASSNMGCGDPGESSQATDCNDGDHDAWPGATEQVADGVDQDCDGGDTCYADVDLDGHGGLTITLSGDPDCADTGESTSSTDCDDGASSIHPGASEIVADATDQDCDGGDTCFADTDLDGYGSASSVPSANLQCADIGESGISTDCNDTDAATFPGAAELVGDGIDQDCNGGDTCYVDADGDGQGGTDTAEVEGLVCDAGTSSVETDCDDGNASIWLGATEQVADGIDQDCDGLELCFVDADADNYGADTTIRSASLDCADPEFARVSGDCDDTNPDANPAGTEVAADGIDEDCDSWESCFVDADDDGFGTDVAVLADLACSDAGAAPETGDCDDGDAAIRPDAEEIVADGIDSDCDDGDLCFADGDGDGFGGLDTIASANLVCTDGGEGVSSADCDDTLVSSYPGATETCNGVDDNCDGTIDEGLDCGGEDTGTVKASGECGCSAPMADPWAFAYLSGLLALMVRRRRALPMKSA